LKLLRGLETSVVVGDYMFVHAGVRPGVPLDAQLERDLIWIREPFLDFEGDLGKFVIHGHTPVPEPDIRVNRIDIDTLAWRSGTLTALVLEGADRRFLQT
jgi:serine/threonine protein phosphatase 1